MGFVGSEDFAFGPFRLSVRHRTLADPGGWISLKSRAFDVLLALIECRGAVVSKDELMRRVWGQLVVEENNLHVQVAAVRRALGPGNRYILTIPGRGYRFTGRLRDAALLADPEGREAPTTNLPAQMTILTGRREELAAIAGLLGRARLVTLTGPSGAGKTKLAIEAARSLRARFPAGCWWAGLGSVTDGGLALRAVAASLRTDEIQAMPLFEGLADLLGRGQVVLVLDGCERVAGDVANLADRLLSRCPRLKILCTSHAPLGLEGEQVRGVAPLAPAAAVRRAVAARSFTWPVGDVEAFSAGSDDGRAASRHRAPASGATSIPSSVAG
jgi:DNA-binding winged helix-turn-helix (wHTH) protein